MRLDKDEMATFPFRHWLPMLRDRSHKGVFVHAPSFFAGCLDPYSLCRQLPLRIPAGGLRIRPEWKRCGHCLRVLKNKGVIQSEEELR